jgi:hypothetical protein
LKPQNRSILTKDFKHLVKVQQLPSTVVVHVLYMNSFEGQFSFLLKDNAPDTLAKAKEYNTQIKENIIGSRIDPF